MNDVYTINTLGSTDYYNLVVKGHTKININSALLVANRLCRGSVVRVWSNDVGSASPYLYTIISNIEQSPDVVTNYVTLTFTEYGEAHS